MNAGETQEFAERFRVTEGEPEWPITMSLPRRSFEKNPSSEAVSPRRGLLIRR
jgi:hypothetical protein